LRLRLLRVTISLLEDVAVDNCLIRLDESGRAARTIPGLMCKIDMCKIDMCKIDMCKIDICKIERFTSANCDPNQLYLRNQ
jgi:hypothetical protein